MTIKILVTKSNDEELEISFKNVHLFEFTENLITFYFNNTDVPSTFQIRGNDGVYTTDWKRVDLSIERAGLIIPMGVL